jgi:mono/diheme cytochrome c family protein
MRSSFRAAVLVLAVCGGAQAAESDLGARLFFNHCAACHGDDAEGSGPVAAAMRVTVPNLRSIAMRNGGTFPADAVAAYIDGREGPAAHGDRQMPVWGDVFSPTGTSSRTLRRRIEALVEFIEELQYR